MRSVGAGGISSRLLLHRGAGRGVILGRFSDAKYNQQCLHLEDRDRLLLYTDGIVEARNRSNEDFGEQRLHQLLRDGSSLTAEDLADDLIHQVHRWIGDDPSAPSEDDLTVVIVDVDGAGRERPK